MLPSPILPYDPEVLSFDPYVRLTRRVQQVDAYDVNLTGRVPRRATTAPKGAEQLCRGDTAQDVRDRCGPRRTVRNRRASQCPDWRAILGRRHARSGPPRRDHASAGRWQPG